MHGQGGSKLKGTLMVLLVTFWGDWRPLGYLPMKRIHLHLYSLHNITRSGSPSRVRWFSLEYRCACFFRFVYLGADIWFLFKQQWVSQTYLENKLQPSGAGKGYSWITCKAISNHGVGCAGLIGIRLCWWTFAREINPSPARWFISHFIGVCVLWVPTS